MKNRERELFQAVEEIFLPVLEILRPVEGRGPRSLLPVDDVLIDQQLDGVPDRFVGDREEAHVPPGLQVRDEDPGIAFRFLPLPFREEDMDGIEDHLPLLL